MSDPHAVATTAAHASAAAEHAGLGAFPPFDPAWFPSQILWFAITFGVFYYLVRRTLGPTLAGIVEGRADRIAADLAAAERLQGESEEAAAAYDSAIAEARRKAGELAAASRAAMNADIDAKRAAAETALAKKLAVAEGRVAAVKAEALTQVGTIATDLVEDVVARLSGTTVSRDEAAAAVAASR
jgi:F-type H+-transporting ATPase subunit b